MISRMRNTHRGGIVTDMERLCEAYIQLANWGVENYKRETSQSSFIRKFHVAAMFCNSTCSLNSSLGLHLVPVESSGCELTLKFMTCWSMDGCAAWTLISTLVSINIEMKTFCCRSDKLPIRREAGSAEEPAERDGPDSRPPGLRFLTCKLCLPPQNQRHV